MNLINIEVPKKEIESIVINLNVDGVEALNPNLDFTPRSTNYIQNNIENKRIGDLGELWIVELERKKLENTGKIKLAQKVRHISKEEGDGHGYDIQSFDENGNEIFIEVKTTKGALNSTFFITRNELERSKIDSNKYFYTGCIISMNPITPQI